MTNLQKTGLTRVLSVSIDDNEKDRFDDRLTAPITQDDIGWQTTPQLIVVSGAATASTTTTLAAPIVNIQTSNQYWVAGKATIFTLPSKTFIDPQGTALTYTATLSDGQALPSWLKFAPATGRFSGTEPAGTAPITIRVTATDVAGLSGAESFTISLAKAPTLSSQTPTQYFAAGRAGSFTLSSQTFTDPQGSALTYTASLASGGALPSWLSFNASTRSFSGTAPVGIAPVALKVTATDTYGLAGSETFNVALASAPTLALQTATQYWLAGQSTSFVLSSATFADPQALALSYSAALSTGAALPSWLTFNAGTRTFSGTDPAGSAAVSVKVTATDTVGLTASEIFSIALATAPNVAAQTANQIWVAGKTTTLALPTGTFVDPQGLVMTYSATQAGGAALPSWLQFTAATASFTGIDPAGTAPISIVVTAKDSAGATGSESFTISLAAPPRITNQAAAQIWTVGQTINFTLPPNSFTDPQGAALTYSATLSTGAALPSWLVFNAATQSFTGTVPTNIADFSLTVTAIDSYGLSAAETFAVATPMPAAAISPFVIKITYDASVAAAPAGFKTAIATAVTYLQNEFTNPVTLNITVGYGSVNGSPLSAGNVAGSQTSYDLVSYADLRAALAANGTQPDQITALASLPSVSPMGGAMFIVANAQAKALGLAAAVAGINDGYIGISATNPMNFDPANRAIAGTYDAIGAIEHEIAEVMGRTGSLSLNSGAYTAFDLFRYTSPGVRDLLPAAGYFSIDGQTMLQAYNSPATGGDLADWAPTVIGDAFGNASLGVAGMVTAVDLTAMNVIGWNRASLTS